MKLSSLIELKNIVKLYQQGEIITPVLHGINLKVNQSELLALMGTSGSGKTTLMNIIGLLDKPTEGEYYFNGKNLLTVDISELTPIRNRMIGFIFQQFYLLPYFTILENVSLPLVYREMNQNDIEEHAHTSLQRVGLDHLSHRYPKELSGGQQQRIAIARALVGKPSIILADEPTGALDSKTGQDIMNLFVQLNEMDKNTIIIITHDSKIASQCQRIIHMQDGLIVS
jgi:putative ABC transport system ATP-binding protein